MIFARLHKKFLITGVNIPTQKWKLFMEYFLKTGNFSKGNFRDLPKNKCLICCKNTITPYVF